MNSRCKRKREILAESKRFRVVDPVLVSIGQHKEIDQQAADEVKRVVVERESQQIEIVEEDEEAELADEQTGELEDDQQPAPGQQKELEAVVDDQLKQKGDRTEVQKEIVDQHPVPGVVPGEQTEHDAVDQVDDEQWQEDETDEKLERQLFEKKIGGLVSIMTTDQ